MIRCRNLNEVFGVSHMATLFYLPKMGKQIKRSLKIWMGSKQQINFNDTLYESCLFNYFSDRFHCRLQ